MIPKTIHYCWFGGKPKSKLALKCIESWKRFCPDYEIIEWNEENFDVNYNPYTKMCYEQKKYAFLTDYLRLKIIYEQGGLYFDTDVEMKKNFDELLCYRGFFGFETDKYINTGVGFGAEPQNEIVFQMLQEYDTLLDANHGVVGCPVLNTVALENFGLQKNGKKQDINGVMVLPSDYLNPYDDPTGILQTTENTFSIHWYGKSWVSKGKKLRSVMTKPLHRLLGVDFFKRKS